MLSAKDSAVAYHIRKKSFLNKTLVISDVSGHMTYEKRQRGFFKTKKALYNATTNEVLWETCTQDNTTQAITFYGPNIILKLRSGATHSRCPLNSLVRASATNSFCWDSDHYNWLPAGTSDHHSFKCLRAATGCEVAEFIATAPLSGSGGNNNSSGTLGVLVIHGGKEYGQVFCEFLLFALIHLWEDAITSPPSPGAESISMPASYQAAVSSSSSYVSAPITRC
ncbi:hypothetical protein H4R33_003811 [Dimargaris cristalligena]|nr:hypothetical protein H4R33_003811 [Dimargaris cristalligena]